MPVTSPNTVLVVDDDADARDNLRDILELDDYDVVVAGSIAQTFDERDWNAVFAVLLDRKLPDGQAIDVLHRIKELAPHAAVLIVTGYDDLDGAIAALREGVEDYLLKPINPELLRNAIARIVDRQRMTEENRRSEAAFRHLVHAAECMIVIIRDNHSVAYFSPFAEQLSGYSSAQVLNRDYLDLFLAVEDRPPFAKSIDRVITGKPLHGIQSSIRCRDGSPRNLLWNARRLVDYDGAAVCMLVGQDITSLQRAQTKLVQAERLAAIGQMVTGLAHESRNALQRSQACLELLEYEVGDNVEAIGLVRRIQNAQDHLHKLFDEVRGYAGPIQLDRCLCPIRETWREAWEQLARQRAGRDAELTETIVCDDDRAVLDRFRIVQVFRNLLENSLAACDDPVRITLECRESEGNEGAGRMFQCTLHDNGPGLNSEQKERIFEPFFTTKTRGTGLGMAIAQRVVKAHGGNMRISEDKEPGAKTIIQIPYDDS